MVEKIEQHHRDRAAERLRGLPTRYGGDDPKMVAICDKIVAGLADDHPSVQGEAFYEANPHQV